MPRVEPEVLVWARTTSGLSIEEAAKKLGIGNPDRLREMEAGDIEPSRRQIANMSQKYRRPLLSFYLPRPPRRSETGQDFRTLPEDEKADSQAILDALLRDISARHGLVRAALEEAEEDERLPFVGSRRADESVEDLSNAITQLLQFNALDFRAEKNIGDAFAALRSAVESIGVFVLLVGNLGNYLTDLDAKVFRGFAIADPVAPFIVINENDSRAAWSFTLLHELTHLLLGQSGVSGYDGDSQIERLCDSVAAKFLLNPEELNQIQLTNNLNQLIEQITQFANSIKVSRKMVAFNLVRFGKINRETYRKLSDIFDEERLSLKQEKSGSGAPVDYYVVRRHRIGPGLIRLVDRLVAGGVLNSTKAARVLGVKPTTVSRITSTKKVA